MKIVNYTSKEIADNSLQEEADAFFDRVMQVYKESFKITNDRTVGLFKENKKLLAWQLYEYASTRHQIADQSGNSKPVKMERSARILLNRLKIFYEWRKERFGRPEVIQIEQQREVGKIGYD